MRKAITWGLLLLIFIVPYVAACQPSMPATLAVHNISLNNAIVISEGQIIYFEGNKSYPFPKQFRFLNISENITHVSVYIDDKLIFDNAISNLTYNDKLNLYEFPKINLFDREIKLVKNDPFLRQYDSKSIIMYYDSNIVFNATLHYFQGQINHCGLVSPLTFFIAIVVLIIIFAIIRVIIYLIKKKKSA